MTINHRTGKTLCQGIIESLARLDAQLSLMDHQDHEELFDWIMNGGSDVSIVARSLLYSSILDTHQQFNITKGSK